MTWRLMEFDVPIGVVVGICSFIAFVTSCVSIYLTGAFMYKLGGDDTTLKIVFSILGISLDVVKHILPVVVFYAFLKRSFSFATMLCVFYVGLSAFSFISSVSALETKIEDSLKVVVQNTSVLEEIEILKDEREGKKMLMLEQKSANQISAMKATSKEISNLNSEIRVLMNKTQPSEETILSSARGLVIYMSSGLIELLGLVLMVCVLKLDTRKGETLTPLDAAIQQTLDNVPAPKPELPAPTNEAKLPKPSLAEPEEKPLAVAKVQEAPVVIQPKEPVPSVVSSAPVAVKESVEVAKPEPVVTKVEHESTTQKCAEPDVETQDVNVQVTEIVENTNTETSVATKAQEEVSANYLDAVKQDIVNAVVQPNVRSIVAKHKISREDIRLCLNELADAGKLIRGNGNRFKLAS